MDVFRRFVLPIPPAWLVMDEVTPSAEYPDAEFVHGSGSRTNFLRQPDGLRRIFLLPNYLDDMPPGQTDPTLTQTLSWILIRPHYSDLHRRWLDPDYAR